MKAERKVRISQCMIVKNEERNMERALSWGKEIMWEQIVVDTGSTDHTVEIARRMGARVYSFPWRNDFSAAKNYAIEQARGEWIAFLDADEYIPPEDVLRCREMLNDPGMEKYDGISMGWQQLDGEGRIFSSGTQIRFFRNLPEIRYRRRIHEQLISTMGRELRIGDAVQLFSVFHTGYQGEGYEEKKKTGRNRRLILAELEEHAQDHEMLGYMGDECFSDGDREEAEKWYRRSIQYMPSEIHENDQRSAVTYTRLLMILTEREKGDRKEIEEIYTKACTQIPWEADFAYVMGRYFASVGQAEGAVACLEEALGKLERFGCSNKALLLAANLTNVYDLLARCCYETGDREKCVTYAVTCLKYNRYEMSALSRLLMLLASETLWKVCQEADRRQILEFFAGIYDFASLKDRLFLVKAAERSGCVGFGAYVENSLFSVEERAMLRNV